jgi:RHS repeat-associated protein
VSTISGDTANGTTAFAYDALDRLTTYTPPTVISPQTYTWNGQPDRASIQTGTGTPLTVTFDAAGRPTSDSSSGTYSSDGQGRITAVPGKTMTYDALGRLTQVVGGSSTANYTYDALDRLRTINVGSATNRFRYVGTTDAVAQILDNVASTVLTNHATDLDGTELFDFAPGGSSQAYLGRNDHGDVTWSATTTGAVSARVSYDPYGNVAASSGTTPASRWQGSYYDSTSGFYYVNARWYAPSLGTFLSEDPLTHKITDPASRDEYAYGSGDAVDETDVSGESAIQLPHHFWQYDPRWASALMDPSGRKSYCTFASDGCAMTAAAMVVDYYRVTVPKYIINRSAPKSMRYRNFADMNLKDWTNVKCTGTGKHKKCTGTPPWATRTAGFGMQEVLGGSYENSHSPQRTMDPLSLDAYLLAHSGLVNRNCDMRWTGLAWRYMKFTNKVYGGTKHPHLYPNMAALQSSSQGRKYLSVIQNELGAGRPVIAMVGGAGDGRVDHFVVITGIGSGDFSIDDPARSGSSKGSFDPATNFGSKNTRYQLAGIVTMQHTGPAY